MRRFDFASATALVTGAAGGIGEELARGLAARGADLVLVDVDAAGVAAVAESLRQAHPGQTVGAHVLDLADRAATVGLAAEVAAEVPGLNLLVNNAGVAAIGEFRELSLDEFDHVMDVNFRAPVALVHTLLPTLLANPGSHIVNMSSLFGLMGPAGQSAYSSSKFALRGFSEVLHAELAPLDVGVTVVHPGGVRTNIARSAHVSAASDLARVETERSQFDRLLRYPPERAAAEILSGVQRRARRVLVTPEAHVGDLATRLTPTGYSRLLDLAGRAAAMVTR